MLLSSILVFKFTTGIEYIRGARRTSDDTLGKASRIQMMAKLSSLNTVTWVKASASIRTVLSATAI